MSKARESLGHLGQALNSVGIQYSDIDISPLGHGLALNWTDGSFMVIATTDDSPGSIYLTTGIVRQVDGPRTDLLEYCNDATRANPGFPTFIHDADAGQPVLTCQR